MLYKIFKEVLDITKVHNQNLAMQAENATKQNNMKDVHILG